MKIIGLDHVAIATNDAKGHGAMLEKLLGLHVGEMEINPGHNLAISFLDAINTDIEFLQPLDSNTTISKFLARRGPGIHHLCFLVENIEEALQELIAKNVPLIDTKARIGAEGSLIAFLHPDAAGGVLIELKEKVR
jgi:methylmalonyl-CoA/ethylmalonyl-CoA epimerase